MRVNPRPRPATPMRSFRVMLSPVPRPCKIVLLRLLSITMTPEENDLLCRVEGDAPMGKLMRRHWVPVGMAEEIPEPDGTPLRARLLGEDLVVFRDSEGKVGVLGEYCPHRGASLVYGRNEEGGLRCLYHGWKFDVEGRILEMSSEPHATSFADRLRHVSYPARESGGFVWVYMGPVGQMPAFQPPP